MSEYLAGLMGSQVWATYRPANAMGAAGIPAQFLGVNHANTGGVTAGLEGLPTGGTTTALDTFGTAYDGSPNAAFDKIVTKLILRNIVENMRTRPIVVHEGAYLKAKHVPGTKSFVYTFFADLGAAEDLLEGVSPEPEGLTWDTFEFTGTQKGKIVAITDLADLFSPFDLYSQAAEKLAWNAIDTAEAQAVTLLTDTETGVGVNVTVENDAPAANIIATVVAMKEAEVMPFPDGTYHGLISPADAAFIMTETGELGWTDAAKYAGSIQGGLLSGELGTFRGVRFIESNRIPDHKTVILAPGSFVWGDYQTITAYRQAPGGDHSDLLAQRGLAGWKGMWGMSLTNFDGSPAIGPASNTKGFRFAQVDLTGTA